jgi:hypothetical protein
MMITPGVRQLVREIAASRVVMDEISPVFEMSRTNGMDCKMQTLSTMVGRSAREWQKYLGLCSARTKSKCLDLTASLCMAAIPAVLRASAIRSRGCGTEAGAWPARPGSQVIESDQK